MRLIQKTVILMFSGIFLLGCESKKENTVNNEDTNIDVPGTLEPDILSAYIQLKDAFVATDYDLAKTSALNYKNVVKGNVDIAFEKALLSVTDKIIAAKDVEEQRAIFEQISELMYALAENGQFEGRTLYKQYCPMAFNNKGAFWLSLDENILNPYFGEKMLKCGYIEEVL